MKTPDSKLRRLVDEWHDGTISPEDALALERRLVADGEARSYFFEIAAVEATLPAAVGHAAGGQETGSVVPLKAWRREWPRWAAVFAAGTFVGAMAWLPGRFLKPDGAPSMVSGPVASVSGMRGVTWKDDGHSTPLTLVTDEVREIESGLIELSLESGTRVLLEGPAGFAVTGANGIRLTHGKLVADVPKGAEGFLVDYPDGEIVDLGTEFAANISPDGGPARFGVFRGEIECRPNKIEENAFRLLEGHAVLLEGGRAHSIPFDQSEFVRELPSREFSWSFETTGSGLETWDFDVSHLIYKPGTYMAICKTLGGDGIIRVEGASLSIDGGPPVAEDFHPSLSPVGRTLGEANAYLLVVPPDSYRRGRWILSMDARPEPGKSSEGSGETSGILLFEEGLVSNALPEEFIGTWEYLHDGDVYRRTFLADHTSRLTINDEAFDGFNGSTWRVEEGNLILSLRDDAGQWFEETHCLRNHDTLIFINRPYRNASRVATRPQ